MLEKKSYICSMDTTPTNPLMKVVKKANDAIKFCTKEEHLKHIDNNISAYKSIFTNQHALIDTIKDAHEVWLHSEYACILNVSFLNNLANEIHKTDLPLFLPFDIDLKGIEGYAPSHNEMCGFINRLKIIFGNSLVFAYVSKSGKGIHFGLNVDKNAFLSIEAFNSYLTGLELRICNDFFSFIVDTIDTDKIFDRSLYNISENGISYKNLTISINTEFLPYFTCNKTEPFVEQKTFLYESITRYDILDKQHIAIEVNDNTPIANKVVTNASINDLITTNEGRMKLARYIASGCLTYERVANTVERTQKNNERLKELKATVKIAIKKGIKEHGYVTGKSDYKWYVKNDVKGSYHTVNPIFKNGYIYPDDYLEIVKKFRTVFVVSENTGAGKTTTLLNAYKDSCLYVVPNISVLNDLNKNSNLPIIHSQLEQKDTFYKAGNRIGITYAYLNELIQNNEQYFFIHVANNFKAVVFDEVDYVASSTVYNIERLTQYLKHNTEAQIVFCTATPFKCSLIHDLCDIRLLFKSGKPLVRNVNFYKYIKETDKNKKKQTENNKYISVIEWFLKQNNNATNIIYLNNRKMCLRIKDTLKEYDIKLYNSEEKEFELDNIEGNMLVTSSVTAGLNMYVKDTGKPVNYLMLGSDLTNSLIKQVTGRVRNKSEVNVFLERLETHKETVNTDVRYIHETKDFCDKELLDVRSKTNINSLIEFVERKYVYHIFDKKIPLSISFFWNKIKDKYNSEVFRLLNTKNYNYSDNVLEVEKTKTKLNKQQVEKYENISKINSVYKTEFDKLTGSINSQANFHNVEIKDNVLNAINLIAVLCAFFDKQKDVLGVFKSAFYTFVNNFQIIKDHFTKSVSWINNETTLKTLVDYNVITNTVANTLSKNKKYAGLYRKLFDIIHTRKCNLLVFKHDTVASVIECFLSEFENITKVKLTQTDILGLELFVQQYETSSELDYTILVILKEFLDNIKKEQSKTQQKNTNDCEGALLDNII